jgi:ankyrin repeat protein
LKLGQRFTVEFGNDETINVTTCGVLRLDGQVYAMTCAHNFKTVIANLTEDDDDDNDHEDHDECDDEQKDEDEDEAEDKIEDDNKTEHEDEDEYSPQQDALHESGQATRGPNLEAELVHIFPDSDLALLRLSDANLVDRYSFLHSPNISIVNKATFAEGGRVFSVLVKSKEYAAVAETSCEPVIIMTSHGNVNATLTPQLDSNSGSSENLGPPPEGLLTLHNNEISRGDSGSLVINPNTGEAYGMLLGHFPGACAAVFVPFAYLEWSMRTEWRMNNDQDNQCVKSDVTDLSLLQPTPRKLALDRRPSESFSLLPEDFRLLPQIVDTLCELARFGDLEALKQANKNHPNEFSRRIREKCLANAVENGHLRVCSWLIDEQNTPVYTRMLRLAAQHEAELCKLIVRHMIQEPTDAGLKGFGPLHVASRRGKLDVVKYLISIDQGQHLYSHPNIPEHSPLDEAAFCGFPEIVELLSDYVSDLPNTVDNYGKALRMLVLGHQKCISCRRTEGIDSDHPQLEDTDVDTETHQDGWERSLDVLLSRSGGMTSQTEANYCKAMQIAAENGDLNLLSKLLDVKQWNSSMIGTRKRQIELCLCAAAASGCAQTVEDMMSRNAAVDSIDEQKYTALQLACKSGHDEVVRLLLSHGANIFVRKRAGRTTLELAAAGGYPSIVEALLHANQQGEPEQVLASETGATFGHKTEAIQNFVTASALRMACASGNAEVVTKLLEHVRLPVSPSENEETLLQLAARKGHTSVVEVLLGVDVDPNLHYGRLGTPLEIAAHHGFVDVVKVLLCSKKVTAKSQRALEAAVKSSKSTEDLLHVLLKHQAPEDVPRLLYLALGSRANPQAIEWIFKLLEHIPGSPSPYLLERFASRATRANIESLLSIFGTPNVTTGLALAITRNRTDQEMMAWFVSLSGSGKALTRSVITLAVANRAFGGAMMEEIFRAAKGIDFRYDQIWEQVVENDLSGLELLEILLGRLSDDLSISGRLVRRCFSNWNTGDEIMHALINSNKTKFTPGAVIEIVKSFQQTVFNNYREAKELRPSEFGPVLLENLWTAALRKKSCECDSSDLQDKSAHSKHCQTSMTFLLRHLEFPLPAVDRILPAVFQSHTGDSALLRFMMGEDGFFDPQLSRKICSTATILETCDAFWSRITVTKDVLQLLVRKPGISLGLFSAILEKAPHSDRLIDAEILTGAASNPEQGHTLIQHLLKHCKLGTLPSKVLESAVRNPRHATDIVSQLFEKWDSNNRCFISKSITSGALYNWPMMSTLISIFSIAPGPAMDLDETAVTAAASKLDAPSMQLLLSPPFSEIQPSLQLLTAAAGNWEHGPGVIELLLDQDFYRDILSPYIPKRVLRAAVNNWKEAPRILALLRARGDLVITENILQNAAENPFRGVETIKILLKCAPKHIKGLITSGVLKAAAANFGSPVKLLDVLLPLVDERAITDDVLRVAAGNGANGVEVMRALLRKRPDLEISPEVLQGAASNHTAGYIAMVVPLTRDTEAELTNRELQPIWKNQNRLFRLPFVTGLAGGAVFREQTWDPLLAEKTYEMEFVQQQSDGRMVKAGRLRIERSWQWYDGLDAVIYLLQKAAQGGYQDRLLKESIEPCVRQSNTRIISKLLSSATSTVTGLLACAMENEVDRDLSALVLGHARLQNLDCKIDASLDILIAAAQNSATGGQLLSLVQKEQVRVPFSVLVEASKRKWINQPDFDQLLEHADRPLSPAEEHTILTNIISHLSVSADAYELAELVVKRRPGMVAAAMEAAAANQVIGPEVCRMLAQTTGSFKVPEIVLVAAASNAEKGLELLQLLSVDTGCLGEKVYEAAAGNEQSGYTILQSILGDRTHGADHGVTTSVLAAAAKNASWGLQLLQLLLPSNPRKPFIPSTVIEAGAANWRTGLDVVKLLLTQECAVDERCCVSAAGNTGCGYEILEALLDHSSVLPEGIRSGERVWEAACRNLRYGHLITTGILRKPKVVTFTMLENATDNLGCGEDIMGTLLSFQHPGSAQLALHTARPASSQRTDAVAATVAVHLPPGEHISLPWRTFTKLEWDTVRTLADTGRLSLGASSHKYLAKDWKTDFQPTSSALLEACKIKDISAKALERMVAVCNGSVIGLLLKSRETTIDWLAAASGNKVHALELVEKLLTMGFSVTANSIVCAINHGSQESLRIFLGACQDQVFRNAVSLGALTQAAKDHQMLELILLCRPELQVDEQLLQAAASHTESIKLLLDRVPSRPIAEIVLKAAAKNQKSLEMLLSKFPSSKLTEGLLMEATANADSFSYLLQQSPKLKITESILNRAASEPKVLAVITASGRPYKVTEAALTSAANSVECLDYLLLGKGDLLLTQSVLVAAAAAASPLSVMRLFEHDPELEITEAVMLKAVQNALTTKFILGSTQDVDITEAIINEGAAASLEVFELLQEYDTSLNFTSWTLQRATADVCKLLLQTHTETQLPVTMDVVKSCRHNGTKLLCLLELRPEETINAIYHCPKVLATMPLTILRAVCSHPAFQMDQSLISDLLLFQTLFPKARLETLVKGNEHLISNSLLSEVTEHTSDASSLVGRVAATDNRPELVPFGERMIADAAIGTTLYRSLLSLASDGEAHVNGDWMLQSLTSREGPLSTIEDAASTTKTQVNESQIRSDTDQETLVQTSQLTQVELSLPMESTQAKLQESLQLDLETTSVEESRLDARAGDVVLEKDRSTTNTISSDQNKQPAVASTSQEAIDRAVMVPDLPKATGDLDDEEDIPSLNSSASSSSSSSSAVEGHTPLTTSGDGKELPSDKFTGQDTDLADMESLGLSMSLRF